MRWVFDLSAVCFKLKCCKRRGLFGYVQSAASTSDANLRVVFVGSLMCLFAVIRQTFDLLFVCTEAKNTTMQGYVVESNFQTCQIEIIKLIE